MLTMEEMRLERERVEKARRDKVEDLIDCIHFEGGTISDASREYGEIEVFYKDDDFLVTVRYLDEVWRNGEEEDSC